jgi:hypothetical protein
MVLKLQQRREMDRPMVMIRALDRQAPDKALIIESIKEVLV